MNKHYTCDKMITVRIKEQINGRTNEWMNDERRTDGRVWTNKRNLGKPQIIFKAIRAHKYLKQGIQSNILVV